jgi:hypothetical protein
VVNSTPSLFALPPLALRPKLLMTVNSWISVQSMWNTATSTEKFPSAVPAFTPAS